eukprot:symbB.v1.2.000050.t1/scaffold2.1/size812218/4
MQLRFGARSNAYLCSQATPDKARCVCKLGGFETTEWQMLGHLAMWMPDPIAGRLLDVHLSLDRRCPDMRIPDICICSLLVLTMLSALLCLEAARALRSKSEGPEESWSTDAAVEIATPLQIFSSGFGWILGFITSVMTLQTVVLLMVKKSETPEMAIWLLIYFPCLLAAGGAYRLTNLLCKKQLMHAFLRQGICLTGPKGSRLDLILLLALSLYALVVVLSVGGTSLKASAVVSLALLGPAWTLVKALRTAQETEGNMDQLIYVRHVDKLASEPPKIKNLAGSYLNVSWQTLVNASRKGSDELRFDTSSEEDSADFNLFRDILWHRQHMLQMGSWSGVVVLPAFALMVFSFAGISCLQAMSYACSQGELADLQLASSLHNIAFRPAQQKYVDLSFKQATLIALADAPNTRWISVEQPGERSGRERFQQAVEEDSAAVIAEISLARQRIPRVATVETQGLRPSLPPTKHLIRFSPLKTLPATLRLSSGGFQKTLAWSTLPQSVISLPPGIQHFNMTITLHDFFLGMPLPISTRVTDTCHVWTVFEGMDIAKESDPWSLCEKSCEENLDCLAAFPGRHGCFLAYNNHTRWMQAAAFR